MERDQKKDRLVYFDGVSFESLYHFVASPSFVIAAIFLRSIFFEYYVEQTATAVH